MANRLTLDQALVELNDRLGWDVDVAVRVERGDSTITPLSARGRLSHWTETSGLASRDDLRGLYDVAAASFDVSEAEAASLLADDEEPHGIRFELADGSAVEVVWGAGPDED